MLKKDLNIFSVKEPESGDKDKFNKKNPGKKNSGRLNWKIVCYLFIVLFSILGFVAFTYLINFYPNLFNRLGSGLNILKDSSQSKNTCSGCLPRFIDGSLVNPGEENIFPAAVVIDNHPDGRPAFGLSGANLVYEAEAEGGITRYLAFFAGKEDIKKIGPIRSARPYFVDWVKEISALFVHCGGSPEALARIYKENIFDFNEFYQGSYFWRSEERAAPYNIFTSSANLRKYLESKNLTEGKFLSWQFKGEAPSGLEQKEIEIGFKYPDFTVKWKYNKINNEYVRYLGGEAQKDGNNSEEIKAKNVIIQYTETKVIDDELRLKINTLGSGKAVICLDGKCGEGEWQKSSLAARTRYYVNEEEVKFNPGKIWIEIVRPELEIIY